MKLGVVLEPSALAEQAEQAEALGFDIAWIEPGGPIEDTIVAAASLAPRTSSIRLAAVVPVGRDPVRLAEDAAVADLVSGGRFLLALAGDDPELLAETVDVFFRATAPSPFAHRGARWTVPARLPANEPGEERLRVTPAPLQLELPIWLLGEAAPEVAASHGLSCVASEDGPVSVAREAWSAVERRLGPAAARLRRPALRAFDGGDPELLVASLRADREAFGLDVAVVRITGPDRATSLRRVATHVRPRLQLDRLPDGLGEHWAEEIGA